PAADPADGPAAERRALAAGPGSLRVRVLAAGSDGEPGRRLPVCGCLIQAWPGGSALVPFDGGLSEQNTDERGEVVFAGLAPGTAHVLLAADRSEEPRPVHIESGAEARLEIARTTTQIARGVVVDADGTPVSGAEIWVHRGTAFGRYNLPEPLQLT